jgi:sodium-dependent dicarboxylate transporter 2/3/5
MEKEHRHLGDERTQRGIRNLGICLLLAIAYSANFGGIATIIGTPPNVAYTAFLEKKYGYTFQFSQWMMIGTPMAIILMMSLYWVLTKMLFRTQVPASIQTRNVIKGELDALGPMTVPEKRVLAIFSATALLWITKDLVNTLGWIKLDDNMIAIFGALLLFAMPAGQKHKQNGQLLEWPDTGKMAWGILLLFGGGITLANQLEKAGIIEQLGGWMAQYAGANMLLLIAVITVVSIFLSEVMSNVAQVIVFAPVLAGLADALGIDPLLVCTPMTLAASCASMLPMGTPPNAIVFASGRLRLGQMLRAGLVMNVVSIILITLFCYYLLPAVVQHIR